MIDDIAELDWVLLSDGILSLVTTPTPLTAIANVLPFFKPSSFRMLASFLAHTFFCSNTGTGFSFITFTNLAMFTHTLQPWNVICFSALTIFSSSFTLTNLTKPHRFPCLSLFLAM
ncbi:hypothetical protein HanRHA438_Chr11g0518871 [Helianthus annuus]|nr:hypothetical protein HanRHA438_Chr11g0518871 [Helianthus annuus]